MTLQVPQMSTIARHGVAAELRLVVLLAGRIGRTAFGDGIQRSVLDLPVGSGATVFTTWAASLSDLAQDLDLEGLVVRVAIAQSGEPPRLPSSRACGKVRFEVIRDAAEYRGTAGVVRDLSADLAAGDGVLVAMASQIQREPLVDVLHALGQSSEGVSLVPCGVSDLAGVFVVRRRRLEDVAPVGFVDLKEQALAVAGNHPRLRASRRRSQTVLPVRTLDEYIHALRVLHAPVKRVPGEGDSPYAEAWRPTFSIVEPGAHVAESASIYDSVVLDGATVEAGAVIVRSVVCPGVRVRRGTRVVETVVQR